MKQVVIFITFPAMQSMTAMQSARRGLSGFVRGNVFEKNFFQRSRSLGGPHVSQEYAAFLYEDYRVWYTSLMPYRDPDFENRLIEAQDLYVWEAPAYERYERGPRWYLFMSLVALGFVAYAVWTTNYLFAFIVLIGAILLVLVGNEKPKRILIQIGQNGVVVNGEFMSFDDLRHFAIVYQPPRVKVLYLYPRGLPFRRHRIYLGEQNPVEIRQFLRQYLEEDLDLRDEHFSDILGKLLKL
jgi:hypothetical protein